MCNPDLKEETKSSLSQAPKDGSKKIGKQQHYGVLFGSISVFISFVGAMQSARSGLTLVGAFLIGRLSDRFGRHSALVLGILSSLLGYMLSWKCASITEMWIALIPGSLLNQNFTVLKALFAEYNDDAGGTESERASALGRLGMAVGVGFMFGPILGTTLLKSYDQGVAVAFALTIISSLFILPSFLPVPMTRIVTGTKPESTLMSLLSLPVARTPGARLLMFMKVMMSLAFAIFMTMWTVSVKSRFTFGPQEHAFFMCWVGLWYALSQGLLARVFIKWSGEDPTVILLACVAWLGLGRVVAMLSESLVVVYITMALVIVALGIVNTAISSAVSHLADAEQVGGLFGLLDTLESFGGLVGPVLGGLLHKLGQNVALGSVVLIYFLVFLALWKHYRSSIVLHKPADYSTSMSTETSEVRDRQKSVKSD